MIRPIVPYTPRHSDVYYVGWKDGYHGRHNLVGAFRNAQNARDYEQGYKVGLAVRVRGQ